MTIRTLILSGGGGRGAFHAGVYKYLSEAEKSNVETDHRGPWQPDIVVGTSIGAVNGAAIAQGISAEELERFWLSLSEADIQGLPPGMGWLARRMTNNILRRSIGTPLPRTPQAISFAQEDDSSWTPFLPFVPKWLSHRIVGRFRNLLDTGPLYQTLLHRLKLDEQAIANSATKLLISATNVRTGEGVYFSNQALMNPKTDAPHPYIRQPITLRRIIASCSIPIIYPWTTDDDGEVYWDGAVVANTPLAPAFDAARDRPLDEPMEALVVMMTPWEENEDMQSHIGREHSLPTDLGATITWVLDWALLGTFRASLLLARQYNALREAQIANGQPATYREVRDVIIAPPDFLPVERIIDYDEEGSSALIQAGYDCAKDAFEKKFPAK